MIRRVVLYPVLLMMFPVLSLYAHNVHEVRPVEVLLPLVVVAVLATAVWAALGLAARGAWHKAGLVMVPLIVFFFAVGAISLNAIRNALDELQTHHHLLDFRPLLLELAVIEFLVVALVVGLIVWRVREPAAAGWTASLNRFALVLVLMPILTIAASRTWFSGQQVSSIRQTLNVPMEAAEGDRGRPDIYYIILDGFGRDDVLREIYDHDLDPFLQSLENHGFVVTRASTSNYGQTRLSLASSLNGSYLDDLKDPTAADEDPLRDLIQDNGLVRALRGLGYTIVDFDTGYHLTENLGADIHLGPKSWGLSEFQTLVLRGSALAYLLPKEAARDPFAMARARITAIFDLLPSVAQYPGPTFTFAHVLAPHPPFLFDANGKPIDHQNLTFALNDGDEFQDPDPQVYIRGYRNQAAFLAGQVESMVQRLLASSPRPPIVIIQADHGPGSRMSHRDVHKTDLHERFSILNAYHLPKVDRKDIPQDITPVNTFRYVLDHYFQAELPLLPNRSFYATWWKPFDFIDVTQPLAEANQARAAAGPAPRSGVPPGQATSVHGRAVEDGGENAQPVR